MDIVGFRVEEAYIGFEIPLSELKELKKAMDNSTVEFDSTKEEHRVYHEVYMNFYNMVKDALGELESESSEL